MKKEELLSLKNKLAAWQLQETTKRGCSKKRYKESITYKMELLMIRKQVVSLVFLIFFVCIIITMQVIVKLFKFPQLFFRFPPALPLRVLVILQMRI